MQTRDEIVELLSGLALFGDLPRPQLQEVAHTFEEEWFNEGQRIVRQGFAGTGFYVIVQGDASVRVGGQELTRLGKGDFFGEVSILLGETPVADVVALSPLRCLVLGGPELEEFLLGHPKVMFRLLQAEARRLRSTTQWVSQ